ncbi:dipeptide/oligopeptide/nickel ABC transporter permease/ATP-binding protein [Actinocrispum wychmicini]|uniref:Oligopeptide/dipeptide ABC transporter ATP-binding protein n=1 Tax=Actinocrispum wychmicini TaxID=1213861 RepID=A0A4R2J8S5_9PSEU|nr:dipeptide/oligopeptide/nickel ABC transporter permease/ATP-binding protein [Actinocrispum wychmicini]TCO54162.1 oligopeptide/dipeptide ABC transporter ATP-binding protein [Actinocrispum wychmicini]
MVSRRGAVWLPVFRSPVGASAAILLVVVLITAIVAPILWSDQAAAVDTAAIQRAPSAKHLLGTDGLGRDILYRLLVATRLTVELAVLATLVGTALGIALGTAPSVLGRRAGTVVTAIVNIAVAFPGLLLILFFAVVFGVTTQGAVLALAVAMAPFYARLTQTLAAAVAGKDFVAAALASGVSRIRILTRHILPNIGEQLVVNAMIGVGGTLLTFAGLSFLGIGIQPPDYDWGRILNEGVASIYVNPAAALGPAMLVVLAGLSFNLFGEAAAQVISGERTSSRRGVGRPSPTARDDEHDDTVEPILHVRDLRVSHPVRGGWTSPVRGVSFSLRRGEAAAIVGESGSGKSQTALAIAQLIERPGLVTAEALTFGGLPLAQAPGRVLGTSLAMVFQDPMTSMNPTMKVGRQLAEVAEHHQGMSRTRALAKAVDRLQSVRIPSAARRAHQYPHEFSGGMRQRAMIAMGLMGTPKLIIADEPTTALDVTVQSQVLRLLADVRETAATAVLLISHDIAVVRRFCDRVLVMYAGRIVEDIRVRDLVTEASHPYTRALLASVPDMSTDRTQPLASIPGRPPHPDELPPGCAFAPRCPAADERCRTDDPALVHLGERHRVACWHPRTLERTGE